MFLEILVQVFFRDFDLDIEAQWGELARMGFTFQVGVVVKI